VNTILKLNQNGDCDYVDLNQWSPRDVDSQLLKEYLAMNFSNRVDVAILAGTDYNPSIHGIGIMKAVKHIYRQVTMKNVVNKLKMIKAYTLKIPDKY
jgi:5'-3' exonuclease